MFMYGASCINICYVESDVALFHTTNPQKTMPRLGFN